MVRAVFVAGLRSGAQYTTVDVSLAAHERALTGKAAVVRGLCPRRNWSNGDRPGTLGG
jgi:hypothetical protein